MKKYVIIVILALVMVVCSTGCAREYIPEKTMELGVIIGGSYKDDVLKVGYIPVTFKAMAGSNYYAIHRYSGGSYENSYAYATGSQISRVSDGNIISREEFTSLRDKVVRFILEDGTIKSIEDTGYKVDY